MSDIRDRLARESERVTLAPDAAERMFERGRRRERTRRATALVVGLSITIVIVGFAIQAVRVTRDATVPASLGPSVESYDEIAATYTVWLSASDADVARLGLEGSYTMRLRPSGVMLLSVPPDFPVQGTSIVFRTSGNLFTVNAFANLDCKNTVGTYRWSLDAGVLTFSPVDEPCEVREVLFASKPWRTASS